ncbi:LysM peptidoglycan-binding domain-containing protein, partial [Geobacillus sp. FW23]|uniref:LysM peptidoglycan-binding domain-containing protein n=1 Tax=Geobacillus sp. FW23 TaxID=1048208 RepID=UPI000519D85A
MKKTIAALTIICCMALSSHGLSAEAAGSYTYYQVKKGDTSKIAKQYHTTVASLKLLNHLKSDAIYAGERLKVPAAAKRSA